MAEEIVTGKAEGTDGGGPAPALRFRHVDDWSVNDIIMILKMCRIIDIDTKRFPCLRMTAIDDINIGQ